MREEITKNNHWPLYQVDIQKCNGCGKCIDVCNVCAAHWAWNGSHKAEIDIDVCAVSMCGKCVEICPQNCIEDIEE